MNKTQTFSKKAHELRQQIEDALSFSSVGYTVDLFKYNLPNATEFIHVKNPHNTHIGGVIVAVAHEIIPNGFVDVKDGKAVLVLVVDQ